MRRPICAVIAEQPAHRARAGRTLRALRLAGLAPVDLTAAPPEAVAEVLAAGPAWLVRGGAWPASPLAHDADPFPPPSDTGLPLCALGAVLAPPEEASPDPEAAAWAQLLQATGGDLSRAARARRGPWLPGAASVYLDAPLAAGVAARVAAGEAPSAAVQSELGARRARVVRHAPLDVADDPALRVAQIVTSLQQGGAERIAIDLTRELPRRGVRSRLHAVYRPTRPTFGAPPGTVDLSEVRGDREARFDALACELAAWGADLAHAHLLDADDLARLAARGFRPVVTVHNTRAGWPAGLARLGAGDAALLVACARAVEEELAEHALPVPVRTVWNGIDLAAADAARRPGSPEAAAWRRRLEIPPGDLVLLAVANPRPQKRLHLLPAVLSATRAALARAGDPRPAWLVIAGSASPGSEPALAAEAEIRREIDRLDLRARVRFAGPVVDVAGLLAAADVLVSPSAHEGLSLAHLEALAAGLPVVATGGGGTAEIARGNPAMTHLPVDAAPEQLAEAVVAAARARPAGGRELVARHFSLARMAEGYARLYPRAVERNGLTPPALHEPSSPAPHGPSSPAPREPTSLALHEPTSPAPHEPSSHAPREPTSHAPREPTSHAPHHRPRRGDGLLLVTNNFSTGGAQSSARRLLLGLAAAGVRARAAVIEEQPQYPTPGRRALLAAGIPVMAIPPPADAEPADAVELLLRAIEADPPEAVVLWNVIAEHKVLLADGLLDIPLFDVSPGEMYFTSLRRYFTAPRRGLPYCAPRDYGARLAGVIVKYEAEAALAAEVLGAPVHVVPNGVELGAPPAPRAGGARLVIGTAARIHPHKKLDDLLAALRLAAPRLPPHVLRVAGGVDRGAEAHAGELRRLAEGLSVEWLGELGSSRDFLRELDLFALIAEPAGCPNASLEAMAEGLPVVATAVGGMAEQVEDGVTGRLVPPGDAAALAEALVELAADPAQRARMGAAGRARAAARFSLERMVADYTRICLGGRGATAAPRSRPPP